MPKKPVVFWREKTRSNLADWSSYPWDILSQQQANIYFPNGTRSSFIKVTPPCPANAQMLRANTDDEEVKGVQEQ